MLAEQITTVISEPSVTPNSVTSPATFDSDRNTYLSEEQAIIGQRNDVSIETNTVSEQINTSSIQVEENRIVAEDSALIANGAANNKGLWSNLTGALNIPSSVNHNGSIWTLNVNLADVTLSEPSLTNSDWLESLGYTKTEIDNMSSGAVNYLFNGVPKIWRRGESFDESGVVNNYLADRWRSEGFAQTAVTVTRTTLGFKDAMSVNIGTSANNGVYSIVQRIENTKALAGKTVVFSFKIQSDGVFSINTDIGSNSVVRNLDATIQELSQTATFGDISADPFTTVRFKFPQNTTGTIVFTDVKLGDGAVANPLEEREDALELILCKRYLPYISKIGIAELEHGSGYALNTTACQIKLNTNVDARIIPTSVSSIGNFSLIGNGSSIDVTAISFSGRSSTSTIMVSVTVASGLIADEIYVLKNKTDATAQIEIETEL